jgi:GAF domain-containing protein
MKVAPLPTNEFERLKALAEYEILDTLPEQVYDEITRIATELTGMPIALLNLIDQDRQWTKAWQGFQPSQAPRALSFCAHAILEPDEVMVVEDARYDERFHDNPMTVDAPHVVFYAGVPIVDGGGHALGTLCVVDHRPRTLPESKQQALSALAKLIHVHFELRKTRLELARSQQALVQATQANAARAGLAPRAQGLLEQLAAHLLTLRASSLQGEQTPQLRAMQQTLDELRTVLETA